MTLEDSIASYTMGALCIFGGIMGFARTRSVPSIVAGVSVGSLYLLSASRMSNSQAYGLEGALGASIILFLSSVPRARKGPVPAVLTVASALVGSYYGLIYYQN